MHIQRQRRQNLQKLWSLHYNMEKVNVRKVHVEWHPIAPFLLFSFRSKAKHNYKTLCSQSDILQIYWFSSFEWIFSVSKLFSTVQMFTVLCVILIENALI